MFFGPFDEYPHTVECLDEVSASDGMGGMEKIWLPVDTVAVFLDTPNSQELLYAMQMNRFLDRHMYYPYGLELSEYERFRFEGVDYEPSGDEEDQGGMHEVMRMPLKRVL